MLLQSCIVAVLLLTATSELYARPQREPDRSEDDNGGQGDDSSGDSSTDSADGDGGEL